MVMTSDTTSENPSFDVRSALDAERAQIRAAIADIDDNLSHLKDPDADADHDFGEEGGEGAGASVERDRDNALRSQLRERLILIDDADHRLENHSYGCCVTCHQPIAPARLEALPAATECVGCAGAPILARRSR